MTMKTSTDTMTVKVKPDGAKWRASLAGEDAAARGRTPRRALERLIGKVFEPNSTRQGATLYQAVGFWDDADELVIVGLFECSGGRPVGVFGGDDVSEGGPWSDSFAVPDGQDPEQWVLGHLPTIGADEDDD